MQVDDQWPILATLYCYNYNKAHMGTSDYRVGMLILKDDRLAVYTGEVVDLPSVLIKKGECTLKDMPS